MRRIASISFFLLYCVSNAAYANDFCDNAPFVQLNHIISHKQWYLGVRIRTNAILKTDLKEYMLIEQTEGSGSYFLVGSDGQSGDLENASGKSDISNAAVSRDFIKKYKHKEGMVTTVDWSKIVYYRQERLLCGRVIMVNGSFRFAIDDSILKNSYLLDWKKSK